MKSILIVVVWLIKGLLFGKDDRDRSEFVYTEPTESERAEMRKHAEDVVLRQLGLKR